MSYKIDSLAIFVRYIRRIIKYRIERKGHSSAKSQRVLDELGENIRLARLRRKLTVAQTAERAGISRATLWQIEKGKSSVSMGAYFQVLFTMSLEKDLLKLAADDELGRKIQDAGLLVKSPKRRRSNIAKSKAQGTDQIDHGK